MKTAQWLRSILATALVLGALCPPQALAQVPARFYWKTLSDANAVPVIVNSISGNTNPFDPAHVVVQDASGLVHGEVCARRDAVDRPGEYRVAHDP